MTNKELLSNFRRYNKIAREVRAKKLGFVNADAYIKYLLNSGEVAVEKVIAPTRKRKVYANTTVPTIHIVDVLDSSGSMAGGKHSAALRGINEGVKDLKLNTLPINYTYTLCDFSSDIRFTYFATNPKELPYSISTYTRGTTALYDAIGNSIRKIDAIRKPDDKVLINVYTDGEENASREFNSVSIAKLIKDFSERGITVTFIGTQHDTEFVIKNINIHVSNTHVYDGSAEGLSRGFSATNDARVSYSSSVLKGEDVSKGFYKKIGTLD